MKYKGTASIGVSPVTRSVNMGGISEYSENYVRQNDQSSERTMSILTKPKAVELNQ
jgi:hypothetical protein